MWTLGFDTTSATVTAALLHDSKPVCYYSAYSATSHSTTLLPTIENLLAAAGIKTRDLSLISCCTGPGSFTGVRIGCASAKGLAAPFDIPCVGVSSLEAMASTFDRIEGVICPALNARRGNVYTSLFTSDALGKIERLTDDDLIAITDIPKLILSNVENLDTPIYVVGDSINEVSDSLCANDKINVKKAPALLAVPSGYGVAVAGEKVYFASSSDKSAFCHKKLVPTYLRITQAEREKNEKNANR